jgi:Ca2+/H+ antiporter, TMEM165/GDT1 family
MFSGWMQLGPSALAGFLASSVECVEALTIILAVGSTRGWREALVGTAAALAVLAAIVGVFGETLEQIPLAMLQIFVGGLLLIFGMRWLRKSILRFAGIIPLHDEDAAFAAEQRRLGSGSASPGWDVLALATTFQITMLEGAEVVFIVLGIGAGGPKLTEAASVGALLALLVTAIIGAVVHRPLANVPENLLKFIVGILLTAFDLGRDRHAGQHERRHRLPLRLQRDLSPTWLRRARHREHRPNQPLCLVRLVPVYVLTPVLPFKSGIADRKADVRRCASPRLRRSKR